MEWEEFRKHLGLTAEDEQEIKFIKDNLYDLSPDILNSLNNLKQYYEMKQQSIDFIKIKILEEIDRYKDEFEKSGYDVGYDDGYADGLNARKRK